MNRIFESADRYLERSDWKDIPLMKKYFEVLKDMCSR